MCGHVESLHTGSKHERNKKGEFTFFQTTLRYKSKFGHSIISKRVCHNVMRFTDRRPGVGTWAY